MMNKTCCLLLATFAAFSLHAQEPLQFALPQENLGAAGKLLLPKTTLRQHNYGAIIGLQKGSSTAIELGYEMHWRKIGLKKPNIWGATANLEYSFSNNIIGYKAGVWRKQGRINLTYGGNLVYFSDFKGGQQFGIGPAVGFRLLGLHLVNAYNILLGDMNRTKRGVPVGANTLYISLRYYFPTHNKFVWDRNGEKSQGLIPRRKKGEERKGLFGKREEEEQRSGLFGRKKEPVKEERKGLFNRKKEAPEPEPEPKGLRKLFPKKSD